MGKSFIKRFICGVLAVASLFCCTACGNVLTQYKYGEKPYGVTDDFCVKAADFSISLFKASVNKNSDSKLISPLSAVSALAMLSNGADNNTLAQLEKAFGMSVDDLNKVIKAYDDSVFSTKECKLSLTNSIWMRSGFRFKKSFLDTVEEWYDSDVYTEPFDSRTINNINKWVKKNTDGMIDSVLDRIDPLAVMYLINATAFDAQWETGYTPDSIEKITFTSYNGSRKEVDMLVSTESVYLHSYAAIGFSKNYAGGRYSFVAMLPNNDTDIYRFADSLNGDKWLDFLNSRKEGQLFNAYIPKFTYNAEESLKAALKSMGITDMFDLAKADFSNMSSEYEELFVNDIRQKVFFDLSEQGTKAAAATIVEVYCGGEPDNSVVPARIYLNRPFVYAVVDNATGLPIFMGILDDVP